MVSVDGKYYKTDVAQQGGIIAGNARWLFQSIYAGTNFTC